jgi:thiamine biosynthesis lipoprotein
MGTKIELWVGGVPTPRAERALSGGKAFLTGFDQTLSRFKADSELTALNRDARETVPVSRLMTQFLEAALWAAEASHGIVDPTLLDAMHRVGYEESREGKTSVPLAEALAEAPPFTLAKPDPAAAWRQLQLDKAERTLTRPAGLMIDSGGSGKGLAADMLASIWKVILGDRGSFVIDCGGDIRVSAKGPAIDVKVADPFSDRVALVIPVQGKGSATSGIGNRIWRNQDGAVSHHLIDPRTGEAAWTGIVAVTAVADSTLIAETIAKTALLSGPEAARFMLKKQGGVIVHASGDIEQISVTSEIERAA